MDKACRTVFFFWLIWSLFSNMFLHRFALFPHVSDTWEAACHFLDFFAVSLTGYSFFQPAQAEIFARQQEMLRKQNLARCVCVCCNVTGYKKSVIMAAMYNCK